jgi:hypothetical protein
MRKILFLTVLLFFAFAFVHAQGNSGNNGNGNGNGNPQQGWNGGNGNPAYNGTGNPWANINAPQWLLTWLQNGGQVPMPLAVVVIHEARSWGQQNFGMNQGQMIQKYFQGQLTIEFVSTSPPSLTFRVRFGGGDVMVILDDIL